MSNLAVKQATYQDIIDLPDYIAGEIINDRLETHPRPAPKHALAAGSIGDELVSPFQKGLPLPNIAFHFLTYGNKRINNEN
jgi:hypothetical protein